LAVLWLNEALCFVSSFVVADSLVLRNRQLLVAANRWLKAFQKRKRIATKKEVIGLFKGIKQPLLNE